MDTDQRYVAAKLLRDYIEGRITNDDLDAGWPVGSDDPGLAQIGMHVWSCYDDLHRHFVDGNPKARAFLEQCCEFLESGEPYEWPVPSRVHVVLSTALALLTLGLSKRFLWRHYQFPAYWPFPSEAVREHHRGRIRK